MKTTYYIVNGLTRSSRPVWIIRFVEDFGRERSYARTWGAREKRGEVSCHYSEAAAIRRLAKLKRELAEAAD